MPRTKSPQSPPVDRCDETRARSFAEQKENSVLQLLFLAARLGNDWALAELNAQHKPGSIKIRAAHTALLPHLDFEGLRLTALAERVGTSKQACGQLIDELEQMGLVERILDPHDGRAKLIRYSQRGRQQLVAGVTHLQSLECELQQHLGKERLLSLRDTLRELVSFLELRNHSK